MSKRLAMLSLCLLPLFLLTACAKMKNVPAELLSDGAASTPLWDSSKDSQKITAAAAQAATAGKHFFIYCYAPGKDDAKIRKAFQETLQHLGETATSFNVNVKDATLASFVERFHLKQAPLPLVLVLAPNGAIESALPKDRISSPALLSAIASPSFQRCLLGIQHGKLVVLCVVKGDPSAKSLRAPSGALDFVRDPANQERTRLVVVDPSNPAEAGWLPRLRIDPNSKDPITCLLAPPGSILGTLPGYPSKKDIAEAIEKGRNPMMGAPGQPGGPSGAAPAPGQPQPNGAPAPSGAPAPGNPPQSK